MATPIAFPSTFALKIIQFSVSLAAVLEGQRIAQPFLTWREILWIYCDFREGWEESPNTTGRDAA
jgi:hypothetical protein